MLYLYPYTDLTKKRENNNTLEIFTSSAFSTFSLLTSFFLHFGHQYIIIRARYLVRDALITYQCIFVSILETYFYCCCHDLYVSSIERSTLEVNIESENNIFISSMYKFDMKKLTMNFLPPMI